MEWKLPRCRCSLIENAIDTQQYCRRASAAEAKGRLGMDPGRLLVGAVGRLFPEKGFDVLIRSVHALRRAGGDVALVIAGEGEDRPRLEALVRELGVGDRVHLPGHHAEPMVLYEAMDVFALSSLREGLPNVLLEAMALEVPVVATRIAGVPRLVQGGDNGLLVAPGSVEELTQALATLAADAGLRARLAAAGRRTVETRYSFAGRMRKIRALYDRLLTGVKA
jgi:glycosyltransferase involved in cell wall biosynthesis